MERLVGSLKVVWRSERHLRQNEYRLAMQKLQFNALAGLVAVFGLVMLSLAVFFALVPYWGSSLAALAVGGTDMVLAALLLAYAGSLKASEEIGMVREIRDTALNDIEEEISLAEAELVTLKDDIHGFIRNPIDALLPAAIGPLISGITSGLASRKK